MSKLDQTLYDFARRARGDARLGNTSKAKAQRRAAVKHESGRKPRTKKEQTDRLQCRPQTRAQHRAKMVEYGLDPDGKMPQLLSGETSEIQHGRLMADAAAGKILARAEDGGKITDDDILRVFRQWGFKKNDVRVNVIPEGNSGSSATPSVLFVIVAVNTC